MHYTTGKIFDAMKFSVRFILNLGYNLDPSIVEYGQILERSAHYLCDSKTSRRFPEKFIFQTTKITL